MVWAGWQVKNVAGVEGGEVSGVGEDGVVLSVAWVCACWCLSWVYWAMEQLIATVLTYVALPWLLVPGAIIDLPLRLLLCMCPPTQLFGLSFAEAVFAIVPEWAIHLLIRCVAVQTLSPRLSPHLAAVLSPMLSSVAAPFVVKENALTQVSARPLYGTLDLSVKADPTTLLKLAGYDHTTLLVTSVEVDMTLLVTPFWPFWRAGARIRSARIEGCCREYRRLRATERIEITQNIAVDIAAEAFVHTWAGLVLLFPCLPPLRPLFNRPPPLLTARADPVRMMITRRVSDLDPGERPYKVELILGPASFSVKEAAGLHPEFVLPLFEKLDISLEVGALHCRHCVDGTVDMSDVFWTGLPPGRNLKDISDSADAKEPVAGLPDGKLETQIGDSVTVTAPLLKVAVAIQRGAAVAIDGKIERLWVRTHFRALQVLLMVAMPTSLPPLGSDALDRRLRRLYTLRKSKLELEEVLNADPELKEIILRCLPPNSADTRGLRHRNYNQGYGHGLHTSSVRWGSALDELETLMKLRGVSVHQSPELTELHLCFMSLRERVKQALLSLLGQREMDRFNARAAEGAGSDGQALQHSDRDADQQAFQHANRALSGQQAIAREHLKAALEADPLLCYIIDNTVYCLDNGVRCVVNKIKLAGGYGSWVDNIFASLDAGDKPLRGMDGVWSVITGAIVEPPAYPEPDEFLVEVTRHVAGFQEMVQAYVGSPLLAAVKCKQTDTIEELRAKIEAEAGFPLDGVQLRAPFGSTEEWDKWAMRPKQTLKEAADGAAFPRQLLLQQPLVASSDTGWSEALSGILRSQILFYMDVQISLPAVVVAPPNHHITTSTRRLDAEIVCEFGSGRIFSGTGRGAKEEFERMREDSKELDKLVSRLNFSIVNDGNVHDDGGHLHDAVDFECEGFRCYVRWTPEGLMAQLDEDTNGTLTTAELDAALQLYSTKFSADEIDLDGDGEITTQEMKAFLDDHPDLMEMMCTSVLVDETGFELRLDQSFLPAQMLRHRYCQGFARSRLEVAIAPIDVVLDMRDMAVISLITTSAAKGFETMFPVDDTLAVGTMEAEQPAAADPYDAVGTEFDIIIGRKVRDEHNEFHTELDGSIPFGCLHVSVSVRRAGVSILRLAAQLHIDVLRQTLGVLRIRGDMTVFGSCENEEHGCWEPWLEPWTLCFSYTSTETMVAPEVVETTGEDQHMTGDVVELCAAEVCTVNVSYALMRDLIEINTLFEESSAEEQAVAYKRRKRRVDLAHSAFILYNDTGTPLNYCISKGTRNFDAQQYSKVSSYDRTWLKAEDMQSVSIADVQNDTHDKNANLHSTENLVTRWDRVRKRRGDLITAVSALVDIGGTVIPVPEIRMVGVTKLLSHPIQVDGSEVRDLVSVIEIDPNSGHKTVSLRSSVQLQNKTEVDLIAQIKVQGKHDESAQFPLPAGTARSVPINLVGDDMEVRVRPISREMCVKREEEFRRIGHHFAQHPAQDEWSNYIKIGAKHRIVGQPYRDEDKKDAMQVTVRCPHLNTEEPDLKFHCHAVWCALDKQLDTIHAEPLGTLAFIPFMVFVNELPCAVRVELLLHTMDHDSMSHGEHESDTTKASRRDSPSSTTSDSPKRRHNGHLVRSFQEKLTDKQRPTDGRVRYHRGERALGSGHATKELESGQLFAVPSLGRWSGSVTVAATITHVDVLYPPKALQLRGMFEDMDDDMDGHLSAREIEDSWDKIQGLDAIFQELLVHRHAVLRTDRLAPNPDGSARKFTYSLTRERANKGQAEAKDGDIFVIVKGSAGLKHLEGYPIGQPELQGEIPQYLFDFMDRGDEIKTFLAGTPDKWDTPLTMEQFLSRFRFPERSANIAEDLDCTMIYHQHVCSAKTRENHRFQKNVPKQLLAAWKPLDEYNAIPLMLPLERMKRGMDAPVHEGLLSMKFHFSLDSGDPVELHLFISHWLVNRGLTPLVAHAGTPVDADGALADSAVSGVIGGADLAVRSTMKGVTGIFTKPVDGLRERGVSGLLSGIGHGVIGAVVDPVTGVLKATTNVVSGTVTSATQYVGSTISGVTGVFTKPIEGAKDAGLAGFATGVGKGLLGAIMAPTKQALATTIDTAESLHGSAEARMRFLTGHSLIKFESDGPDPDHCWGPIAMGPMTPAQGEQPLETIAVTGYHLLGVDTSSDSMCLQLRLPYNDVFDGLAPIKYPTWPDPITNRLPEAQVVHLKLPDQFKGMTLPVEVAVRTAPPPFINSQIVSINSPWTIHNASSYSVHVRTTCGQYEVLRDIHICDEDDTPALLLRQGDRVEAIGLMNAGKILGLGGTMAVCFMHDGSAHWCEITKDGEQLLRRTDMPVLARYEVIADEVILYSSPGKTRSKTGQTLRRGEVVDALKIVTGSSRRSHWIQIDHESTGNMAWAKLSSKGVPQLVENFESPHGHNHTFTKANLHTHQSRRMGGHADADDEKFGLRRGASSFHFDVEQKRVDDSSKLYQTIEATHSSPLLLYDSAAENVFIRVAVASVDFDEPLLWSQCLNLNRNSEGTKEQTEMIFTVRVPSTVVPNVYEIKHICGHVTETGVLVLRDAAMPPYAVHNATSSPLDYRIVPSTQPWWTTVKPGEICHIWHLLHTNAEGHIKIQGRTDERAFGEHVKVYFREAGGGHVSEDHLQTQRVTASSIADEHDQHFPFELGVRSAIFKLDGQTIDSSVDLCPNGSLTFKVWETGQSKSLAPPPKSSTNMKLQGIHACFIDRNQTEWARLAVDAIRISSSPVGLMHVSIISAADLVQADLIGRNDVRVTAEIEGERHTTEVKTSDTPYWWPVHEASARPENFQFNFVATRADMLSIKVWDVDKLSSDDLLGVATIPVSEVAGEGDQGLKKTVTLRVPTEKSDDSARRRRAQSLRGHVVLVLRYDACPNRQPQIDEISVGRVLFGGARAPDQQVTATTAHDPSRTSRRTGAEVYPGDNLSADLCSPPELPIFLMKNGFRMFQKSADLSGAQIKAVVVEPREVHTKLDADFFINSTGFVASLLPLLKSGSRSLAASATLSYTATEDSTLVSDYVAYAQEIKCERPEVIQILPAKVQVELDLDEYITELGRKDASGEANISTSSARAIAGYYGFDLQYMLSMPVRCRSASYTTLPFYPSSLQLTHYL